MKKTLNINLGGTAFIIDENAFEILHNYLEALKGKFSNEAERREIMDDIEARFAEMLTQRLGNRKEVLSVEDVEYVIGIMGKPEDIAGEDATTESSTTTTTTTTEPVKKRLYRDMDDAKIGGVISGLCHYFGINDPVWLRIAAVVLIPITSGTIILIYLLLLVIVPKAISSSEKLQMKGEAVNVNNITKEVKDAANRFGDSVSSAVGSDNFFHKVWALFLSLLRIAGKVAGAFVIFFSTWALVGVAVAFVSMLVLGNGHYHDAAMLLADRDSTISLFSFGFLLVCAMPLIVLIYLGLRMMLGRRTQVLWLKWALLTGWIVGIIMMTMVFLRVGFDWKEEGITKDSYYLNQPVAGTLFVQLSDSTEKGWVKYSPDNEEERDNGLKVNGKNIERVDRYIIGEPHIELMTSEADSFYVEEVVMGHGGNREDALKNADQVIYSFGQVDSVLHLESSFGLPKSGSKWRAQEMKFRIAVPKGKFIRFGDGIDRLPATVKGDDNYDDTRFANTTWTNDNGKIKCLNCIEEKNAFEEAADKAHRHAKKMEQKMKEMEKKMEEKFNHSNDHSNEDY